MKQAEEAAVQLPKYIESQRKILTTRVRDPDLVVGVDLPTHLALWRMSHSHRFQQQTVVQDRKGIHPY
jgi:hypothetical protein